MKKDVFLRLSLCTFFFIASGLTITAQIKTEEKYKVLGCLQSVVIDGSELELYPTYSNNLEEFNPSSYKSKLEIFNKEFGITSDIYFFDDKRYLNGKRTGAAFAVADPSGKKDGLVLIGKHLFAAIFKEGFKRGKEWRTGHSYRPNEMMVFYTAVAHELGHISQAKKGFTKTDITFELDADRRAGACLGKVFGQALFFIQKPSDPNELILDVAKFLFSLGDTEFNSIDVHGNKIERMRYLLEGVTATTITRTKCQKISGQVRVKMSESIKLQNEGKKEEAERAKAESLKLENELNVLLNYSDLVGIDIGCSN
jgi:hypothetical protein